MDRQEFLDHNTRLFRRVAPIYDVLGYVITRVRKSFVKFVAPSAGMRILDVATGTGKQAMAFAACGFDTTGIDLSPDMLRFACGKNRYPHKLSFGLGDSSRLPFPDSSFDIVVMSFALHCMPLAIRESTVAEMARVARGRNCNSFVAFVDYGLPSSQPAKWLAYHLVSLYETQLWRDYIRSDLDALLVRQGLRIVDSRQLCWGAIRMIKCRA